jgi:hypothetical protein
MRSAACTSSVISTMAVRRAPTLSGRHDRNLPFDNTVLGQLLDAAQASRRRHMHQLGQLGIGVRCVNLQAFRMRRSRSSSSNSASVEIFIKFLEYLK